MIKLIETNIKIDKIFRRIADIVEDYLSYSYPAAEDPDIYIELIKSLIEEYENIEY